MICKFDPILRSSNAKCINIQLLDTFQNKYNIFVFMTVIAFDDTNPPTT